MPANNSNQRLSSKKLYLNAKIHLSNKMTPLYVDRIDMIRCSAAGLEKGVLLPNNVKSIHKTVHLVNDTCRVLTL